MKRIALVTGSTSGIGLGIVHSLAASGCDVIVHGLAHPEPADALQDELRKSFGVQVRYHVADLSRPHAIQELLARMAKQPSPPVRPAPARGLPHRTRKP